MSKDEEIIYNFSKELHEKHGVTDATYKAVFDRFGERGAMDLIAVNGYYTLISMVLIVVITIDRGVIERIDRKVHRWRSSITSFGASHTKVDQ